tara:strand:+ start:2539 stop:3372 length:834 start_codon:yes stop_codon:yes gene_type:complete
MKKLILCDGDSWTSGDIINPKLKLAGEEHPYVNHPKNDDYRLPKVWPHKLGKLLDVDVLNIAHAGSSNDGVVRRTMRKVKELLLEYKTKDLFVIIGWSSPERKDFYYRGEHESWETIYPAQGSSSDKDLESFYKIYVEKFWNDVEYVERYIQQNLLLHYYLKEHNIDHIFFDAFYETKGDRSIFSSTDIDDIIIKVGYDTKGHYELIEYFTKLKKEFTLDTTFRSHLLDKDKPFTHEGKEFYSFKKELFNAEDHHPSESGHETWANYLKDKLYEKII